MDSPPPSLKYALKGVERKLSVKTRLISTKKNVGHTLRTVGTTQADSRVPMRRLAHPVNLQCREEQAQNIGGTAGKADANA